MISDNYISTEFGGRVINTRERGLPKVMAKIEVSCRTGYNIQKLRQLIYKTSFEIKEKGLVVSYFILARHRRILSRLRLAKDSN